MGKRKNILFIILGILLMLYVVAELSKPKRIDWTDSFSRDKKIPFGCYVLRDMLPEILPQTKITENRESLYTSSLGDSTLVGKGLIIITNNFEPDKIDLQLLFDFVSRGNAAFISSLNFNQQFSDSLKVTTGFAINDIKAVFRPIKLQFVNPHLKTKAYYSFAKVEPLYFSKFDTIRSTVLSSDSAKHVNFIKIDFGKGSFYLNSSPRVFTNYHMLYSNHDYAVKCLSYLQNYDIVWDEYFKPNRNVKESSSPIRYILSQDSLRYAYLLLIATILLFILFEGKRRQRIMPIVNPPVNSTMEFVETVGRLYFSRKDNKDLAEKKINHFYDYIISNYYLKPDEANKKFRKQFAEKLMISEESTDKLFNMIQYIRSRKEISDDDLIAFIKLVDDVQYKEKAELNRKQS